MLLTLPAPGVCCTAKNEQGFDEMFGARAGEGTLFLAVPFLVE